MDLMQRRRELMAMQTGGLPSVYRRIEYLESSGTQYIDTGVIGRPNISAYVKLSFSATSYNARILGSRETSGATRFYLVSRIDSKWHMGIGSDYTSTVQGGKLGQIFNVSASVINSQCKMIVDGVEVISNDVSDIITTYPMYLFAANNYGSATGFANVKIYTANIWQEGNTVRNFIPCIRKSDNKPGMYDTVSKTFYTNTGTGEFIVPA